MCPSELHNDQPEASGWTLSGVELGEGGYGADLLEELEGVELVPMLD